MALENIVREILEQTKKEAKEIIKTAEKEALKIIEEKNTKLEQIKAEEIKKIKSTALDEKRKKLSTLRLELKKQLLNEKKHIINAIAKETLELIKKLDSEKKKRLFKKIIENVSKEFQISHMCCHKDDYNILKRLYPKIKIEKTLPSYGIVISNKEKTIQFSYIFERIIEERLGEKINEISARIF